MKGRAPKTGYARVLFGDGWVDVDRNGCDTRNDILRRDLTNITAEGRCKIITGTLKDPYSATKIVFVRGGASEVDIDHVVPLSDAWQKGAQKWPVGKRVAFANDPLNLLAVDARLNRQKSDSDAASWLPPNRGAWCSYVARQVAVKKKYAVWITSGERDAMSRVLSQCTSANLPSPGSQPTIATNLGSATNSTAGSVTEPIAGGTAGQDPRFATCKAAKAAGFGPYVRGKDPEYSWYRDGDSDGTVCE